MHFLIEKSTRKKNVINFSASFLDAKYVHSLGIWCLGGGYPFIRDMNYILHQGTKKDDIETGEDQKGE